MTDIDAPIHPTAGRLRPIGVGDADLTSGPWAKWQQDNAAITFPHARAWLERDGAVDNFRRLLPDHGVDSPRQGMWFSDSDVYKVLEGAAWEMARVGASSDPVMRTVVDDLISLIGSVQEEDGYINTNVQAGLARRWTNLQSSHEMYCIGHLIQAAVAHYRASGSDDLLSVATRAADRLVADFGQRRRRESDGHQQIEMAMVELYRVTGTTAYLDLAKQFIDDRGSDVFTPTPAWPVDRVYLQDDVPLRDRDRIAGHAVRALYYLSGATDVAVETDDSELLDAVRRIADDIARTQMYVTGALGSRAHQEELGDAHELPQDLGYGETCATIGHIGLSWRLLLATGEQKYADVIERGLYNLLAASTSADRRGFFYSNPGHRRRALPAAPVDGKPGRADAPGTRPAWFWCACCPPNILRTIASLGAYALTSDDDGVQLHQFFPGRYRAQTKAGRITVDVETIYPADGRVTVIVRDCPDDVWRLSIRRPGWAEHVHVAVVDEAEAALQDAHIDTDGVISVRREWKPGDRVHIDIPVTPRWTVGHPAADAVRGTVVLERGPVVYALESHDQEAGVDLETVEVDTSSTVRETPVEIAGERTLALAVDGRVIDDSLWVESGWVPLAAVSGEGVASTATMLTFIPYALWANRGPSQMRVHVPRASRH
ncbi:glycoside hydrolase family 127 protein [Microbacterium sp. RU33B]|uniref:glycoside hydrolase family 127 protein n=1 Tax=Microbacterium sp. RU33B TaxID=1907390 RepID=UPI000976FE41|nr:beta-L-arabinofuranosidase domain-containing protein [Microbacterium sp. RU33B]